MMFFVMEFKKKLFGLLEPNYCQSISVCFRLFLTIFVQLLSIYWCFFSCLSFSVPFFSSSFCLFLYVYSVSDLFSPFCLYLSISVRFVRLSVSFSFGVFSVRFIPMLSVWEFLIFVLLSAHIKRFSVSHIVSPIYAGFLFLYLTFKAMYKFI